MNKLTMKYLRALLERALDELEKETDRVGDERVKLKHDLNFSIEELGIIIGDPND